MIRQVSSSVSFRGAASAFGRRLLGQNTIAPAAAASTGSRLLSDSPWANYEMAPLDPIIGLTEEFNKDDYPHKVIVGVGAYRDDAGKPYTLPCVREAEDKIFQQHLDMEYSGIAGDAKFLDVSLKFGYGEDSVPLKEGRIQGVQALSGTGGLRVMGELLRKHGHKQIYVPNPTWGNHKAIFTNAGLDVKMYSYYDTETQSLDFDNMAEDLKDLPSGTCVLLHACAHNPTGMDPTLEQWKQISEICLQRKLLVFFDNAYQGFASGCAAKDAAPLRMFVDDGHLMCMVQSFSKNFGLYGHRIGALSVVGANPEETERVISQLKVVIRPMYSNPPRHGARIVETILTDPMLREDWEVQCAGMAARINTMRTVLRERLRAVGSTRKWNHITKQIGMFAYSGLNQDQVLEMRNKHHVYCTLDGRLSMAGVTSGNVDRIANAIHDVTK